MSANVDGFGHERSGAPSLLGKTAMVTGGGTGIGLACARSLVRDGAAVTICGRRADVLDRAAADLRADAPEGTDPMVQVRTAVCDVTDEDAVARAVAAAADASGALHLAVANAGYGSAAPLLSTDRATWDGVLGTNLTGSFHTIKHAAAAMPSDGGSIVAISSIAGSHTHRFMTPYCVSKAGLEMLVRCAADELGHRKVRVNAVRPGLVPTDASAMLATTDVLRDDYLAQMPLGRLGDDEDVAMLVRFLLGPESGWITGQCIGVDGGHHLRRGPDLTPVMRAVYGDAIG